MKFFIAVLLAFCTLPFTVHAQITQKLSLGILGGFNTPMDVSVEGKQPDSFKPSRTTASSTGIFLQYELPHNFYVRGTFKKGTINLVNRYQRNDADTFRTEWDYGVGFDNKQYELNLGYRKNITKSLSFTGSLGATLLDLENVNIPNQWAVLNTPDPDMNYWVAIGAKTEKEKTVLANAALGLEYKTKRGNAFLLEAAYYKGFSTVGSYNFKMQEHLYPNINHYQSALKTKGDYAEVRLGYRMPIQKFVNLYKAVKYPMPDSVRKPIYHGKYWGLETGKQTFYANQVIDWPDRTDKMRTASWTTYLTFYKGYRFKSGLSLEAGIRVGTVNSVAVGEKTMGFNSGWSSWMLTTPVSVRYSIPLFRNKLYLTSEAGLWQSYSESMGDVDSEWHWGNWGNIQNIVFHDKGYGHDYFVGYHAGLSLNGRVGKACEIGIGYRYADRFSKKPVFLNSITYDIDNIPQPAIVAKSRLQNDMVTISFRKFIRKK